MTKPLMDFQCYVAKKYEIRRSDELPVGLGLYPGPEPPNMPHLVEVGAAKLVRPKLEALEKSVGLLLKTKMPKWEKAHAPWDEFESGQKIPDESVEMDIDPDELSMLKRNVLLISRNVGMLFSRGLWEIEAEVERPLHEPLIRWVWLAETIQTMFLGRENRLAKDMEVGHLTVYLSCKSGTVQIRPGNATDALVYCAAQMIARGTTAQTCERCGTPFLEGGERVSNKRRGGARFCTDKCRYAFHYDVRRKAKSKS